MDVGYKNSSGNFSLRAAALIIQDNKLLVAKSQDYDCYYTVGGGIRQNETSDKAVLRECFEETGHNYLENSVAKYSKRDDKSGKL